MKDRALILLSGGADSTAALHWALREFKQVSAVTYDYGQPARDHERGRSMEVAKALGIPWRQHVLCEAVRGTMHLQPGVRFHIAGRNTILLACAAAEASRYWPGQDSALIVGFNGHDAMYHVDCAPCFFQALSPALGLGLYGRERAIEIVAPWSHESKCGVLRAARALGDWAWRDVQAAWSCYAGGEKPCGTCDACEDMRVARLELSFYDERLSRLPDGVASGEKEGM